MLSKNPIKNLALEELGVTDEMFEHQSELHGRGHVNRVIYHGLLLCRVMGYDDIFPEVWAACHLHDLARKHDGRCEMHGQWAVETKLPNLVPLYLRAGVKDFDAVSDAVIRHSRFGDDGENPKNRVCQVLKDADALDRCRLGDLDPRFLRLERSEMMIARAEELYLKTSGDQSSDWMNVWDRAVELYAPYIGLSQTHPPQYDENEQVDRRVHRRCTSGWFSKHRQDVVDLVGKFKDGILRSEELRKIWEACPVQTVWPVIYMSDERLEQFKADGFYKTIWDTGPTWHTRFNDDPLDARAYNEVRLFGESCKHLAHGVLHAPAVLGGKSDERLRQMYGRRRVHLPSNILKAASFTISDNQMSFFAVPYSEDNLRTMLTTRLVAERDQRFFNIIGNSPLNYVELQYHTKITPEMIVTVE